VAVEPPDSARLTAIADGYGLGLSRADVESFQPMVAGLLGSWDAVEQLYARTAPKAPDRAWSWPGDNPLGAWYACTEVREATDGPLAGRTVAIKDNTMVAGVPMMNGSRTVEGFVPSRDATIVSRLLAAGATIAGKAVCEDLCFSGGSHTSRSGPVHNPWDTTRSAGGSSGSAALVASGAVDLATGGDQGGSIRIPSAYNGIVGHKPTHGLVPYTGAFPIEQTIDHIGPMTRTVPDAALVLNVIAGRDGLDPRQPNDLLVEDYLAALGRSGDGNGATRPGRSHGSRGEQARWSCASRSIHSRRSRRSGSLLRFLLPPSTSESRRSAWTAPEPRPEPAESRSPDGRYHRLVITRHVPHLPRRRPRGAANVSARHRTHDVVQECRERMLGDLVVHQVPAAPGSDHVVGSQQTKRVRDGGGFEPGGIGEVGYADGAVASDRHDQREPARIAEKGERVRPLLHVAGEGHRARLMVRCPRSSEGGSLPRRVRQGALPL
jgi:hypothetical protein